MTEFNNEMDKLRALSAETPTRVAGLIALARDIEAACADYDRATVLRALGYAAGYATVSGLPPETLTHATIHLQAAIIDGMAVAIQAAAQG